MQNEFIAKSLRAHVETLNRDQMIEFMRHIMFVLYDAGELESLDRYSVALEGIRAEIDRELTELKHPQDEHEVLACDVGVAYLTVLRESIDDAIDCTKID